METYHIVQYTASHHYFALSEFEEALHDSMLHYSIRHLTLAGITSQEKLTEALQKSMRICSLAGINIKHHFKQVFVYDAATGEMYPDWLLSKKAFKLTIMQY